METKELYPSIFSRKSTRSFDMTPLPDSTIGQMEAFVAGVRPLLPDAEVRHRVLGPQDVKGLGIAKAPHYIIVSAKEQPLREACAGFLYQHAQLFLYSVGLAARWLGGAKAKQDDPDWIVGMAFGTPSEPCSRALDEFDRKSVDEIAEGHDSRLDAARLAPSGMNGQPWHFVVEDGVVHVYYRKRLGGLTGALYHTTELDAGIALCHMSVASAHEGRPFTFSPGNGRPAAPPKAFAYLGDVE